MTRKINLTNPVDVNFEPSSFFAYARFIDIAILQKVFGVASLRFMVLVVQPSTPLGSHEKNISKNNNVKKKKKKLI